LVARGRAGTAYPRLEDGLGDLDAEQVVLAWLETRMSSSPDSRPG
jgi:hypothetical protein